MSTLNGINCSREVVQKDNSVAIGAFSLNGHNIVQHISKECSAYGSHFSPKINPYAIYILPLTCWPIIQFQLSCLETV